MCWDGGYKGEGMLRARIKPDKHNKPLSEDLVFGSVGLIGGGRNSGFQALNLVVQFGASRVILAGYDMKGQHYYGRNRWPRAGNPTDDAMKNWAAIMGRSAPVLERMGVSVVNVSPDSALECFPKMTLQEALA